MKSRKSTNVLSFILPISALVLAALNARAATLTWTGLSTVTNLWSDSNNWSPTQLPTVNDLALFGNTGGFTNVLGAVNNSVDANITISNLLYSQISNNVAANFHGTLINPGVTLTVGSAINATNASVLYVGADNVGVNDQVYATITGAGTLAVGNLASPDTNKDLMVSTRALTANGGQHKGTLDLSGLNKFTFGGGRFQVTGNGISAALSGAQYAGQDRPWGSVLLARTNVITAARPRTDQFPFAVAPFALSVNRFANSANLGTLLELGQENTINAEAITVGGARGGNVAASMKFRTGLTNPTLKLRGADGISRITEIGIGDNDIPNGATVQSIGILDLTLGTVDALVSTLVVGRNTSFLNAQLAANGTGTLTLGPGTCDVTTLNIGCQGANNGNRATGTVNVRTGAILIAGNINIGRDAGGGTLGSPSTGTGIGTLAIIGGLAKVSGDILENDAPGGNGTSTLTINTAGTVDMMPSGDTVPGNITVDTLNYASATLTNYGTLSLTNLNIQAPATVFTVYPGQALAPVAPGIVGTLTVKSNLTLTNATVRLDLNDPSGANDFLVVSNILTLSGTNSLDISAASGMIAPGTYTLMTYGVLAGNTNNLQVTGELVNSRYTTVVTTNTVPNINLIVSGATSNLIWSGDGAANLWNLQSAANWNAQTETFYNLDSVVFDDTSANQGVSLSGTLQPASVTVASTSNYTFSGSGKISGTGGLTNSGTGTLTILTANDYTGNTTVNGGTLLVNGVLGVTTLTVNSGATLGGTGTILGPVTVQGGGTLNPGTSIGTLAISNDLVLVDGSTTTFEANMTTLALDKVVGLNSVTYGGTLNLVLSGRAIVASDTFKLFSATTVDNPTLAYHPYLGAFSTIVPATPPGTWLAWNTSTLAKDGTLRVVSTAPSITTQITGNQLTISWPSQNIGALLQAQTNSISVGLSTNWFDVPGSTSTSSETFTIDPANGSVFYRLVAP
jgi:autotransporter-associated beta strand protein